MGWVENLYGHLVALDTTPIIAFIAREEPYAELVRPLFRAIAQDKLRSVTSTLTLIEVLVRPLREKDEQLATQYQEILTRSEHLTILSLSESIAFQAANLRASLSLRTPDAIQVATALASGADTFITNDKRLRVPPQLTRITLDDLLLDAKAIDR
jgi:predicted nucleic acid-binding protein